MKIFLTALFIAVSTLVQAAMPLHDFAKLPVLHEGRVKPLETYANVMYQTLSGKSNRTESVAWLADLVFDPRNGLQQPILLIRNPEVKDVLGLTESSQKRFSPVDVLEAFQPHKKLMQDLFTKSEEDLTPAQSQLVNLHFKTMWVLDMSRSLSLLRPLFYVNAPQNQILLRMDDGQRYTYIDMFSRYKTLTTALEDAQKQFEEVDDLPEHIIELFKIGELMRIVGKDANSNVFPILPPQWGGENGEVWHSPWATVSDGQGSPVTVGYLTLWKNMHMAYLAKKPEDFKAFSQKAFTFAVENRFTSKPALLEVEMAYNKAHFFHVSLGAYLLAAALGLFFLLCGCPKLYLAAVGVGLLSTTYHMLGLGARIIILERPPVGTLYESILFVSLVASVMGLLLEWRKKDGLGFFAGMLSGGGLLTVSLLFASEGDSMGMLMAVLNTNFWLTTHVLIITAGYAFCVVAAIMAHAYLIQVCLGRTPSYLSQLYKNTLGVLLVALFATALGTLLGGIWADQSWGRFWGWDPKENGALLIVLWIVWLLHGRVSTLLNAVLFMAGAAFLTIIVGVAWFGVNLLSVGLHSYGFSDQTFYGLVAFCLSEIAFIAALVYKASKKKKS